MSIGLSTWTSKRSKTAAMKIDNIGFMCVNSEKTKLRTLMHIYKPLYIRLKSPQAPSLKLWVVLACTRGRVRHQAGTVLPQRVRPTGFSPSPDWHVIGACTHPQSRHVASDGHQVISVLMTSSSRCMSMSLVEVVLLVWVAAVAVVEVVLNALNPSGHSFVAFRSVQMIDTPSSE